MYVTAVAPAAAPAFAVGSLSPMPHCEQDFASGRFSPPHDEHCARDGEPHSSQNLLASRMSARHLGHSVIFTSSFRGDHRSHLACMLHQGAMPSRLT